MKKQSPKQLTKEKLLSIETFPTSHTKDSNHLFQKKQKEAEKAMRKLIFVTIMCTFFMICELIGGYISGSLAIMTDAAHLLSDVVGFVISYYAVKLGSKDATFEMSYGYHRTEILGAMASIIIIWVLLIWLINEAIFRLMNDFTINEEVMLFTALLGFGVNLLNIFVLEGCAQVPETEIK